MPIAPFKLERYFAEHEFKVKYLLSASDCESLTLEELLQLADDGCLKLWHNLKLGYTESAGHPLLCEEVARLYRNVAAENVMIAAPEEAIFIAMHTLLLPGDHVITIFPAYQSLYEVARSRGCIVTTWELELSASRWQLDLGRLENSLQPNTRLLVLNFPHNPTGYLPSITELEAIIAIARRHGLYIFSDEMYRGLEYEAAQRLPSICEIYENGIALSGLSKTFALPGLRLGWLVSQNKSWLERWLTFKDYTTICSSAPSEILGIVALRAQAAIIARNLEIIQKNLVCAEAFFAEHPEKFLWIKPQAGSVAFPKWKPDTPVDDFCREVLAQQSVMIVPGSIFDAAGNHFRLGLGRRNFVEALQRVQVFLQTDR